MMYRIMLNFASSVCKARIDMKKTILSVLLSALLCASASAQNLTPTVDITNTYLSNVGDVSKFVPPLKVDDSLTRFDYKFDYSVFDTPYKGAYEFTPYEVVFNPEREAASRRRFYLNAGAGYSLHPQLDAVWEPVSSERFSLCVHQNLGGYYGAYRDISTSLGSSPLSVVEGASHDGYDLCETAGLDGRFSLGSLDGRFGVDYNGIFTSDAAGEDVFHSALARFSLSNRPGSRVGLGGSILLDFASDKVPHPFSTKTIGQSGFDVNLTVAPRFGTSFGTFLDVRVKYVSYNGADEFAPSYLGVALTPRIQFSSSVASIGLGVRVDSAAELGLAPAVDAHLTLVDGALDLYGSLGGGRQFGSMSEMVRSCHWFSPLYSDALKNGFELSSKIGLRGSLVSRLQFDLSGGWMSEKDMALWGVKEVAGSLTPRLGFCDLNYAYADLKLVWKSPRFDADGTLNFKKSNLGGTGELFDLPMLAGDFRATYNWAGRLYLGASVAFSGARAARVSGVDLEMQPYVDLGVNARWRLTSRLSLWAQGGNLLNQAIQQVPLHVESGINFTAGLCLCL